MYVRFFQLSQYVLNLPNIDCRPVLSLSESNIKAEKMSLLLGPMYDSKMEMVTLDG